MSEQIKFSRGKLKEYLLVGFALGKDFAPRWEGQLTEHDEKDFQGYPVLKEDAADHWDKTTYNLRVPYARIEAIVNAMRRPEAESFQDIHMDYLHRTLMWWCFWRRQGVTAEKFAERLDGGGGVHERTVWRWLSEALRHIEQELKAPAKAEMLVFPASYVSPTEGRA